MLNYSRNILPTAYCRLPYFCFLLPPQPAKVRVFEVVFKL